MKQYFIFFLFFCFSSLVSTEDAFCDEWRPLYRGARAQAMGNAFTAIADDEEALFYNPAGLAGIDKFSFTLATGNVDVSNDLIANYPAFNAALSSGSISSINTFLGKDLYLRAQGTSTLSFPGFEVAAIYDQQTAIRLKDLAFPQGVIGTQTTDGVQAGFGTTLLKLRRKKGELRFGLAAKLLWRSGGFQTPSLTQLLTLNSQSITGGLTNTGMGYGMDIGFQFLYHLKKKLTLMAGLANTDLGVTSFSSNAAPQLSNLTAGLGLRYKSTDMTATLSYDYSHILDYMDWTRKNHIGLELKFPVISLYAGMNQLSLTYGVGLDLWLFKVMYVSYGEDQATVANQDSERRTMVSATVKLEL